MGPFTQSFGNLYIILDVDYVSKWIEAISTPINDAKVVTKFLIKNIFSRHGTPRSIISDEGTPFYKTFENLMRKYGLNIKFLLPTISKVVIKLNYLIGKSK